jgi:toxin CcdB
MAQFDVYRNHGEPGYLLDCQADMLSGLSTRLVVPLLPPDHAPVPSRRLNPRIRIAGEEFVMMTHFAAAVHQRWLGEVVGSLANDYIIVMNAFDMLLTGY